MITGGRSLRGVRGRTSRPSTDYDAGSGEKVYLFQTSGPAVEIRL